MATFAFTRDSIAVQASGKYGYSVPTTFAALSYLYEQGLISYPRTDYKCLPEAVYKDVRKLAKSLGSSVRTKGFDHRHKGEVWNDSGVGAHHGIIPLKVSAVLLGLAALSEAQANIYRLICARFVELFVPEATASKEQRS